MVNGSERELAHRRLAVALAVQSPFPWQSALLDRMLDGDLPSALDVPTGLGKTAVIAIWLVARAAGAGVPRRLIYVVDRRAVVDQATGVAEDLRRFVQNDREIRAALHIDQGRALPISTLRGQFVDNREWLVDPSAPAIVLGTIDMVGSRLLFEGYGVSRRMRPYHAGLLGADSLIVLDEAHLVPPFERLVRTVEHERTARLGARAAVATAMVPRFAVLSLSATGRADARALTLSDKDRAHPIVARRLGATKDLVLRPPVAPRDLAQRLAEEAWALADGAGRPTRVIVFCDRRDDAHAVAEWLTKRAGKAASVDIELFVGARRVWERAEAATWLGERGFLAGTAAAPTRPAFLIATSAGEVGVDLDADHMVADLVAWERMVQRLGRVNRRGEGAAHVFVIPVEHEDDALAARSAAVTEVIRTLPHMGVDTFDASPGAITALKTRAAADEALRELITRASTPDPLHPELTRPLVESWSMTSLEDHAGRPEVAPWLRGWVDDDGPRTTVVWREHLPVTVNGQALDLELFLEAGGPHLAEQLETETYRVAAWLAERTQSATEVPPVEDPEPDREVETDASAVAPVRPDDVVAVIVSGPAAGFTVQARLLATKDQREALQERLQGATVFVDVRVGGLVRGLLDDSSACASDVTTLRRPDGTPALPFRVRRVGEAVPADGIETSDGEYWRTEAQLAIDHSGTGDETAWLVVESLEGEPAESENGRSVSTRRAQLLDEHEQWAEHAARRLAERLELPTAYADLLALATRLHDEGKRARRWQQAFRAPSDGVYGKTLSRPNIKLLAGYRHEIGSLPYAERDERVRALDPDMRDLCLHLIAAHHGNARPLIRIDGADEPPSKLEARAQEIALRFARLEKQWGPWGLAWWEALLRAADQEASRRNDVAGTDG